MGKASLTVCMHMYSYVTIMVNLPVYFFGNYHVYMNKLSTAEEQVFGTMTRTRTVKESRTKCHLAEVFQVAYASL